MQHSTIAYLRSRTHAEANVRNVPGELLLLLIHRPWFGAIYDFWSGHIAFRTEGHSTGPTGRLICANVWQSIDGFILFIHYYITITAKCSNVYMWIWCLNDELVG